MAGDGHDLVDVDDDDKWRRFDGVVVVGGGRRAVPGLREFADDVVVRFDPGGGPGGQLPRAGRHLEQPRPAQLDQPLPAQPEPGRHPRPLRQHAHRPRRDLRATRHLDLWQSHV